MGKVLIACEESQAVCKAFRALGHEAYSCDVQEPSGGHPGWHILGDALEAVKGGTVMTMDGQAHEVGRWDLLIAHPPCTYLSNAGAMHLYKGGVLQEERYKKGVEAKSFFMTLLESDVPRICVENHVPSRVFGLPHRSQVIEPWMVGHKYTKKKYLWLKGLPLLMATEICIPERPWVSARKNDNGLFRSAKMRSKTFPGIAKAMAEQWGRLI